MTQDQFNKVSKQLEAERFKTMSSKRPGYTGGNEDVLTNFKRVAERTGLTPGQVWCVYFLKHIDAITSIMSRPDLPVSEAPIGRFGDAMNYLELGWALYNETREEDAGKSGRASGVQEEGGGTPAQTPQEPEIPAPPTILEWARQQQEAHKEQKKKLINDYFRDKNEFIKDLSEVYPALRKQQFVGGALRSSEVSGGLPKRAIRGVNEASMEQDQRVVSVSSPDDEDSDHPLIKILRARHNDPEGLL